ncbi:hypothetical protein Pfo_031432, partial [Paulownia fortunei]
MALLLSTRRGELNSLVQSMVSEGLVNNESLQLQTMMVNCGRDFVVRTVIAYWSAARNLFTKMTYQIYTGGSQEGMASLLSTRRAQLNLFIQSMVAEGLVNNEFLQLQSMKVNCGRDFVVQTVVSYWSAARNLFTQMTYQMDMNVVDYYDIMACACDLLARSNSIGAVRVSIACTDIFNGCHAHDKHRCMHGLTMAKREFAMLQVKLETVVE